MEKLKICRNDEFGELGVMIIDGKEYFPAAQCARILGYSNPHKAVRDHCDEEGCTKRSVLTNSGTQEMKFINEGNLYRLIVRSKLPAAKKFERWVFDEVLPEIRRTGGYGSINIEEVITKAVTTAVSETIKAIAPMLERPAPDVIYDTYEVNPIPRRTHSIIGQLAPEIRNEIDDMILSQKYTYADVKSFLAEQGVGISIQSICNYKKRLYRKRDLFMKVKVRKHKNSPAPRSTEQVKIESTIEKLRKTRTYGVPIHVIYDRGYQHIIDLANRNQKTEEKTPAPIASKQTKPEIAVDLGRRPHYWLDECTKRLIQEAKENLEKKKAEIKAEKELESPYSKFLTNDIDSRGHRTTNALKTPNAFMTSEQKKQVADALVSYVLRVTDDSHYMEQEEVTILPTILDFLAKTDSSKTIRSDNL